MFIKHLLDAVYIHLYFFQKLLDTVKIIKGVTIGLFFKDLVSMLCFHNNIWFFKAPIDLRMAKLSNQQKLITNRISVFKKTLRSQQNNEMHQFSFYIFGMN
jgi:hypothetical protein